MTRYSLAAMAAAVMTMACATPQIPYTTPVSVTPPSGTVAVNHGLNVLDASGSTEATFSKGRAVLESLVAAMPNGSYDAGNLVFGGFKRESTGMARFDRGKLGAAAKDAPWLQGATPLLGVITNDVADALPKAGKAAIVVISDGLATDFQGRDGVDAVTVESARALASFRSGPTCFHTVQIGSDPAGAALLQSLANATSCGSFRTASSLGSGSAYQSFARNVYLGGPAPRVAPKAPVSKPKPGDKDGDGVTDNRDRCPNTLRDARVDARGCWTLTGVKFAVNSTTIESGFRSDLDDVVRVLRANPNVRIRVDGHTDSDGSAAYNQKLSLGRASSVRQYLQTQGGLSASRFEVKGFGESQPAVPNNSPANKRINRRVELTVIR